MNLQTLPGGAQIQGARAEQQDAFGFSDKDDTRLVAHAGLLAIVADGMGGHALGREAAQTAVKAFLDTYSAKTPDTGIPLALYHALLAANQAVYSLAFANGQADNCGSTLAAAVVHAPSQTLHWVSAGDTRLYLFRDPDWVQITQDANYANQLLTESALGIAPPDDAAGIPPHGLTTYLGMAELGTLDQSLRGFSLLPDDVLVLCSDGVYQTLDQDELIACLESSPPLACERILQAVSDKKTPHQDNATVIVIACRESKPRFSLKACLAAVKAWFAKA